MYWTTPNLRAQTARWRAATGPGCLNGPGILLNDLGLSDFNEVGTPCVPELEDKLLISGLKIET